MLAILFWSLLSTLTQASPCTLHAAPDGRYHYLKNREERTVSAYVYWKQASTLVQTLQGLFEYGVCSPWATACLNGICQGVPGCDIRQRDGKWALFRQDAIFSPWISDKEGGQEYLAEIFSVYKAGHICYDQATLTSTMVAPAIVAIPTATAEVLPIIEVPPAPVPELIPSPVATIQSFPTAEEQSAIPLIDLMSPTSAPLPVIVTPPPTEQDAPAARLEGEMDPQAVPGEAFQEEQSVQPSEESSGQ